MRSVADSNRRTRFCRPLPSHSANRPTLYISLLGWAKITKFYFNLQAKTAVSNEYLLLQSAVVIHAGMYDFVPDYQRPIGQISIFSDVL